MVPVEGISQKSSTVQSEVRQVVWYVCRSASSMGEYRGIMNLCRVLPQGTAAKLVVDKAIDRLPTIGSIREDIQRCSLHSVCSLVVACLGLP